MDLLVSTERLAAEYDAADLVVMDASYFPLDPARDARAEYEAAHLPGAVFMDLANLVDADSPLPSMLPGAALFASRMQALGVGDGTRIVLYDDSPHHTAARAWWMLRTFGATQVAILDGGPARWQAEGRPMERGRRDAPRHRHFTAWKDEAAVRTLAQVQANSDGGDEQLVDARGAPRFTGEEQDPRGLALGHIPGSRNLPYQSLFEPDGTWKSPAALRAAFEAAGIDWNRPVVTTCGSGITAAALVFAAALAGKTDVALYDGSWSEWGMLPTTEKATGAARP